MDITSIIGIIAGLAALIGGFFWEGEAYPVCCNGMPP